jgi:hypothetical protein
MADGGAGEGGKATGGPFRGFPAELFEPLRAFADLIRSSGTAALGAMPTPAAATDLLAGLRGVVEQAPAPTAQLDMFLAEVRAKRALITALRSQLESFDEQLDILERSLRPLQEWAQQWARLQEMLVDPLRAARPPGPSAGD